MDRIDFESSYKAYIDTFIMKIKLNICRGFAYLLAREVNRRGTVGTIFISELLPFFFSVLYIVFIIQLMV